MPGSNAAGLAANLDAAATALFLSAAAMHAASLSATSLATAFASAAAVLTFESSAS